MRHDVKKDTLRAGTPRRYKFDLSLSGLIGASTVLLLGLVWVFIFGVLVGRGYQPERPVPELSTLLPMRNTAARQGGVADAAREKPATSKAVPSPQSKAATAHAAAPASPAAPAEQEASSDQGTSTHTPVVAAASAAAEATEPRQAAVLGEEELHYYENLKGSRQAMTENRPAPDKVAKPAPAQPKTSPPSSAAQAQAPSETRPARDQEAADPVRAALTQLQRETQATQAGKPSPPAATQSAAAPPAATQLKAPEEDNSDTRSYAYVYQVASLTNAESASRFRSQVASLGLKADVNVVQGANNSSWHRVIVHFQGRPEETREMKNKLKMLGVEKPLLYSKKPMD